MGLRIWGYCWIPGLWGSSEPCLFSSWLPWWWWLPAEALVVCLAGEKASTVPVASSLLRSWQGEKPFLSLCSPSRVHGRPRPTSRPIDGKGACVPFCQATLHRPPSTVRVSHSPVGGGRSGSQWQGAAGARSCEAVENSPVSGRKALSSMVFTYISQSGRKPSGVRSSGKAASCPWLSGALALWARTLVGVFAQGHWC